MRICNCVCGVSEMTYTVSSGTLICTIPYHTAPNVIKVNNYSYFSTTAVLSDVSNGVEFNTTAAAKTRVIQQFEIFIYRISMILHFRHRIDNRIHRVQKFFFT